MAQPFPLDNSWPYGMRQDEPRDSLPSGAAWNMVNLIPGELQAPLRKRGGWTNYGGIVGPGLYIAGMCYAPFSIGTMVLGVTQNGHLWDASSATDLGLINASYIPAQNPFFYRDKVIFPHESGTYYYDSLAIAALAGSYAGNYGGVFKDHAVLAGGNVTPQRLAFSNAADPTTWDLTLQVWDASFPIRGLGFLRTGILVFEQTQTEIIRGSIPPPGGDFTMSPLLNVGCIDARSIVNWNDQVIWAAGEGVFMTDGTTTIDLTKVGGISSFWRDTALANFSSMCAGIYRDHLIVSVTQDISGILTEGVTLVCDLTRRIWWRFSGFEMFAAVQAHATQDEMYMGIVNRFATISSCWAPSAANKNDGNGNAVTWTLESALHRGFMRLHRRYIASQAVQTWRSLYMDYDLRDAASDNPTFDISLLSTPEAVAYTQKTGGAGQPPSLAETTAWTRKRVLTNYPGNGLAYKLQSSNASADFKLYAVESEYTGREGSRTSS